MTMDLSALFERFTAATWTDALALPPLGRAKLFTVPFEEDATKVGLAKRLIADAIAGRDSVAGVRWRYSGADQSRANAFDAAASFYGACVCAMRDILQAQDAGIREMWPTVEFEAHGKCHPTCWSLRKKRMQRTSPALRTFYPPWHFGCEAAVMDSDRQASKSFSISITPEEMAYFHNPIDSLVAFGFIADSQGLDFGEKQQAVTNNTSLKL